jgi:aryl-alcohol dehydrogenase-like predicted oxidoreductase
MNSISTVPLGSTGVSVTRVGLGGEGVLRTSGKTEKALRVIGEAYTGGIRYFDTAPAYAGSEGYYGEYYRRFAAARIKIFQTSKSAARTAQEAGKDLKRTLDLMGTNYLDLWQIHDIRTFEDIRMIESRGGALEAFINAKEKGIVRYIGVTGHHDPAPLVHAVENWPVDTVLLPVNPVEAAIGGFLTETVQAAEKTGIGIIGMKALGAGHYIFPEAGITAAKLLRFALSQPVSLVISGCSTPEEIEVLTETGRDTTIMDKHEQNDLINKFRPYAEQMAYYRGVF